MRKLFILIFIGFFSAGFGQSLTVNPTGWHIPTRTEYETFVAYLGGVEMAGGKLKSTVTVNIPDTTGWYHMPIAMATNSSGFTMMPTGHTSTAYGFMNKNAYSGMWTVTKGSMAIDAWMYGAAYNISTIMSGQIFKTNGCPVRCIKD